MGSEFFWNGANAALGGLKSLQDSGRFPWMQTPRQKQLLGREQEMYDLDKTKAEQGNQLGEVDLNLKKVTLGDTTEKLAMEKAARSVGPNLVPGADWSKKFHSWTPENRAQLYAITDGLKLPQAQVPALVDKYVGFMQKPQTQAEAVAAAGGNPAQLKFNQYGEVESSQINVLPPAPTEDPIGQTKPIITNGEVDKYEQLVVTAYDRATGQKTWSRMPITRSVEATPRDPSLPLSAFAESQGKAPHEVRKELKPLGEGAIEKLGVLDGISQTADTALSQLLGKNPVNTGPAVKLLEDFKKMMGYPNLQVEAFRAATAGMVPQTARAVFGEVGVLTDADVKRYAAVLPNIGNPIELNILLAKDLKQQVVRKQLAMFKVAAQNNSDISGFSDTIKALESAQAATGSSGALQPNSAPPLDMTQFEGVALANRLDAAARNGKSVQVLNPETFEIEVKTAEQLKAGGYGRPK